MEIEKTKAVIFFSSLEPIILTWANVYLMWTCTLGFDSNITEKKFKIDNTIQKNTIICHN